VPAAILLASRSPVATDTAVVQFPSGKAWAAMSTLAGRFRGLLRDEPLSSVLMLPNR
jgi:hypothetical protein